MDERWLLDPVTPAPTAAELLEFGGRTARSGEHVVWTGPTTATVFRRDLLPVRQVAFVLAYGGLPRPPYRVTLTCEDSPCVSPAHLAVAGPADA